LQADIIAVPNSGKATNEFHWQTYKHGVSVYGEFASDAAHSTSQQSPRTTSSATMFLLHVVEHLTAAMLDALIPSYEAHCLAFPAHDELLKPISVES
jgi:hypothetical protein